MRWRQETRPRRHAPATGSKLPIQFTTRRILRRGNGPEPDTLDPQLARTEGAFNILRDVFEGLTSSAPTARRCRRRPNPGPCRPDGLEYRFTLRDGLALVERRCAGGRPTTWPACAGWSIRRPPRRTRRSSSPVLNAAAITGGRRNRRGTRRQRAGRPHGADPAGDAGALPAGPVVATRRLSRARPVARGPRRRVRATRQAGVERRLRARGLGHRLARGAAPQPAATGTTARPGSSRCTTCTSPTPAPSCASTAPGSSTSPTSCRRRSSRGSSRTCPTNCTSRRSSASITTASTCRVRRSRTARAAARAVDGHRPRQAHVSAVTGMGEAPAYGWVPRGDLELHAAAVRLRQPDPTPSVSPRRAGCTRSRATRRRKPLQIELRYNTGDQHNRIAVAVAAMWKEGARRRDGAVRGGVPRPVADGPGAQGHAGVPLELGRRFQRRLHLRAAARHELRPQPEPATPTRATTRCWPRRSTSPTRRGVAPRSRKPNA